MDITLCNTKDCPIRKKCKRWDGNIKNYNKNKDFNSYFLNPPYLIFNHLFTCDMFLGDKTELLLTQLKGIISGRSSKGKRKRKRTGF